MLEIDGNGNIKVDRGDTFKIPLFINVHPNKFFDARYYFHDYDKVVFYLTAANQSCRHAIIKKEFTLEDVNENKDIIISFEHEDTCRLLEQTYYYEIKLITKQDEKYKIITIAPRRKFIII